tara:strand:+ start:1073 stop:1510 length:438 start_codon:yes stop_codon:yes gene_type:complete
MGLFGRHGSINNFFRKTSKGARRAFTKSKGLINRVATKVNDTLGDKTLNTITDIAGKVINNPLTPVALGVVAPELLPAYLVGKTAFNIADGGIKSTRSATGFIKGATVDRDKRRQRQREEREKEQPSIQRAKKRVVNDTQAIQFL